jgi:hypothetical protein
MRRRDEESQNEAIHCTKPKLCIAFLVSWDLLCGGITPQAGETYGSEDSARSARAPSKRGDNSVGVRMTAR